MKTRTKEEVELFKKLNTLYQEDRITTQEYKMWYTLAFAIDNDVQSLKDFINSIE